MVKLKIGQGAYQGHLAPADQCKSKGTELRPVCVEYFRLNDQCMTGPLHRGGCGEDDCRMVYCLSGSIQFRGCVHGDICEQAIHAGRFGFYVCPGGGCCSQLAPGACANVMQVLFPGTTLLAILGEDWLPQELLSSGKDGEFTGIVREITHPMNLILHSIKEALTYKPGSDLFVVAKALELLWLQFNLAPVAKGPRIGVNDRRAIQKALHIMGSNLEAPPHLGELAHQVGMSVSKFKVLFPRAYGITPYEYIRKMRMERAMVLLRQGEMSVTEVAMNVGYSSISHFAKAFRRTFDISPSKVRSSNNHLPCDFLSSNRNR